MRMEPGLVAALCIGLFAPGCASKGETKTGGTTAAVKTAPAADEPTGPTADARAVTPEQVEEVDNFFRRKVPHMQFECYNSESQRTHKKYQGNVTISLIVQPNNTASDVKVIHSSLLSTDAERVRGTGIEECVMENVRGWEWPKVNSPFPYSGSIAFKPAW